MKRTMLKRKTSLSRVSDKQEIDLAKRRLIKYQLYQSQDGKCAKCQRFLSYLSETSPAYPHLAHKKRLAKGGKTDKKNCSVICSECHSNKDHNLKCLYNEQPMWNKYERSIV